MTRKRPVSGRPYTAASMEPGGGARSTRTRRDDYGRAQLQVYSCGMSHRFRVMVVLCLSASGCAGDDAADTTSSAGDGTVGSTSMATATGATTAETSGETTSAGVTTEQTSGDSGSSGATGSGGATDSTSSSGASDSSGSGSSSGTTGSAQTECGGMLCDAGTEICVERAEGGPSIIACEPVPRGCDGDRTCACVGVPLCTVGLMQCTDVEDNHVFCDSGLD